MNRNRRIIGLAILCLLAALACRADPAVLVIRMDRPGYTPSMEPAITRQDTLLAVQASAVQVGDIVVYRHPSGRTVCHRVIAIHGDSFLPAGDANRHNDGWQPLAAIHYRVVSILHHESENPQLHR